MSPAPSNIERLDDIGLSIDRVTWHWFHKVRDDGNSSTQGASLSLGNEQTGPGEDIARPQKTWHRGSGYSERDEELPDGTISYGWPADTRRKRTIMPPPKLEEIAVHDVETGRWSTVWELDWVSAGVPADIFAAVGQKVFRLDTGVIDGAWSTSAIGDANFSASAGGGAANEFTPLSSAYFGGPIWLGGVKGPTSTAEMWYRDTSGWHKVTAAVNRWYLGTAKVIVGENFAGSSGKAGEERWVLYGSMPGVGAIKWNLDDPADPTKWYPGTAEQVTWNNTQITGIVTSRAAIAFLSTSGVYLHDGTTARWLTPHWIDDHDVLENGRTGLFYRGGVMAAHRSYVDWVQYGPYVSHAPRKVQPGAPPIPNNTPIQGTVTAMTTVEGEPACAVYMRELNQSAICLGFPAEAIGLDGSVNPLIWHFAYQILPGRCDQMHMTSLTPGPVGTPSVPYLHCFCSNAPGLDGLDTTLTARWFKMRMARGGNPLQDPSYPFATEWTAYLTEDEVADGIMVTTRRNQLTSSGGDFAVVSVSADGGAYVEQGHVSSPGSDWTADEQVSGRRMRWKIEARGWEDDPYKLLSFTPHYILTPDEYERDIHQVVIQAKLETRNGSVIDVDIATEEQFLRYLATLGDIYYIDPTGLEWLAKFVPGSQRLLVEINDDEWAVFKTFSLDKIRPVRYIDPHGTRSDDGGVV